MCRNSLLSDSELTQTSHILLERTAFMYSIVK